MSSPPDRMVGIQAKINRAKQHAEGHFDTLTVVGRTHSQRGSSTVFSEAL